MLVILLLWFVPIAAIDPVIGVIIAASVGAVGAYLAAAHKMSGKIATTEAAQLWEESRSIRDWSAARIDKCDEEILRLTEELNATREELSKTRHRVSDLEKEKRRLERVIREREEHHDF